MQRLPYFVGCGYFKRKFFQNAAYFSYLVGVTCRLDAWAEVEIVLQSYADIRSQDSSHGQQRHLVTSCTQYRKMIVISSKQPVCRGSHDENIFRVWTKPAEDSENSLDKDRGLDDLAIEEVSKVVKMTDVITFEFKTSACFPEIAKNVFNIREGIPEHEVFHTFNLLLLPLITPIRNALGDGVNRKVHRSQTQRAHFRLDQQRICESLLDGHLRTAASGDVDDGVRTFGHNRANLLEMFWISRGLAVLRIPGVEMENRGSSRGCLKSTVNNLRRSDRKIFRHRRSMHR